MTAQYIKIYNAVLTARQIYNAPMSAQYRKIMTLELTSHFSSNCSIEAVEQGDDCLDESDREKSGTEALRGGGEGGGAAFHFSCVCSGK